MKSSILLPFFLFLTIGLVAQTNNIVRGIITHQNSNSKPASDVQVTTFGANPVYTNSAGQFELRISGGKPGQTVRLIVQKESFQVLGPDPMVYETGIRDNPDDIIRIVLANVQAFQERMDRFMGSIDKRIQEQNQTLNNLRQEQSNQGLEEAEHKALTEQIAQLYKRIEELESGKEALARQFAAIDLDQSSAFIKDALDRFEQGDVEGAIALMNKDKLDAYYQQVLDQEEKVEKAKVKAIENYMVLARMQRADLQAEAAVDTYREAIAKDSTNVDNLLELGTYLTELNLDNEALIYFARAMENSRDDIQTLGILTTLGNILTAQNLPELADSIFQAANALSQKLDLPTPLPRLGLLNSQGFFCQSNGKPQEAEQYYLQGIALCQPLFDQEPLVYYDSWSTLNSNLVFLYIQTQEFEKTAPYSDHIIQAFSNTPGERTPAQIFTYTYFLNNLGYACAQLGLFGIADTTLTLAHTFSQDLISSGVQTAIPLQGLILNNSGMSQLGQGEIRPAISLFEQSLEIYNNLSVRNPLPFLPIQTTVTSNLAVANMQLGDHAKAETYFQQSIRIFQDLITVNPSNFLPGYLEVLEARLPLVEETQTREDLIGAQSEILELTHQLEALFPGEFKGKLATSGGEMAWNLLLERDFQEAIRVCLESLDSDPSQTWINSVLAPAYVFAGDFKSAKSIYEKWKGQPYSLDETQAFRDIFLQDLEILEQAGIEHKDFGKVRNMLK